METIATTVTLHVEELKQKLLRGKTIQKSFRFPLTQEQAKAVLIASYQVEVESRGRQYIEDEATEQNLTKLAEALTDDGYKFGLMMCGISGNGKTTMMNALRGAIQLMSNGCLFEKPCRLEVIDAIELSALYARNEERYLEFRKCPLLGIEDMGREPREFQVYGNAYNPIIELLEYRYARQLFTVITTNLEAKEVREKYGPRIADRFNEMLKVIIFKNSTYRK